MKGIVAAKMNAMRKRSALSSSAASVYEVSAARDGVKVGGAPKEPSSHHGKMRLYFDVVDPSISTVPSEEQIDIVLCIGVDSAHVVTEIDNSIVFEVNFAAMKEVIWDHTECSLCFITEDEERSPTFIFVATLVEVEAQLIVSLRSSGLQRVPDQVYVGVLVGRNLPSSPINQRRASLCGKGVQQTTTLPAVVRRELLTHERPPRAISSREQLALEYFKLGSLSFPCFINGDSRGLKLDRIFLYVFPSPDCHERSACLFSYQYEQVDSCEVRSGMRLELRFHRSGAKQPTFIAFQSPDAQYIRDAIWYFKYGASLDDYFRVVASPSPANGLNSSNTVTSTAAPISSASPNNASRRRNSLTSFQDEAALLRRVQSRCLAVGCMRCTDVANVQLGVNDTQKSSSRIAERCCIWYCMEHAPSATQPGSPPRSPSRRNGFLSRAKSSASMELIHMKHYQHSLKYQGLLLKKGGKYQMTKAWNQKIAVLIDTPLGGFLCYYDKLAHCPGQSDAPKERRVIDLSGVICIRRESAAHKGSLPQTYAFDIVTVYRTWTFAATNVQDFEVWISLLGEATERQTSMSPDKALRFPVKCLRDPLRNLPSRNDGTTILEVSSNGVTICSGTEGESEVYNWYYTEIQKWSVAKQHDNTSCCFISCAVNPVGAGTPQGTGTVRYQDFLFQTTDAEAICSTIEFFVGRCMAKLEILALMHQNTLSRQSPRLSLEATSSKATKAASDTEKSDTGIRESEQVLDIARLQSIGTKLPESEFECPTPKSSTIASSVSKTFVNQEFDDLSGRVQDYPAASAKMLNELNAITETPSTLIMSDGPHTTPESMPAVWLKYRLTPPAPVETSSAAPIEGSVGQDTVYLMSPVLPEVKEDECAPFVFPDASISIPAPDWREDYTANDSQSIGSIHRAHAPDDNSDTPNNVFQSGGEDEKGGSSVEVCTFGSDRCGDETPEKCVLEGCEDKTAENCVRERFEKEATENCPVERCEDDAVENVLIDATPAIHVRKLMVASMQGNIGADGDADDTPNDGDSDRFQSFEYSECVVGVVENTLVSTVLSSGEEGRNPAGESSYPVEDDDFEDARSGVVDMAEVSIIVIDGCYGNEEDSLIVLEDDDSNSFRVDNVGDILTAGDPVDEIGSSEVDEGVEYDEDEVNSPQRTDDRAVHSNTADGRAIAVMSADNLVHPVRIAIPAFSMRQLVDVVTLSGDDWYDETLPRMIVYTTRFHRGRRVRP